MKAAETYGKRIAKLIAEIAKGWNPGIDAKVASVTDPFKARVEMQAKNRNGWTYKANIIVSLAKNIDSFTLKVTDPRTKRTVLETTELLSECCVNSKMFNEVAQRSCTIAYDFVINIMNGY